MKQPTILVVTATLGNRETLERTIKSVQAIGKENVFHVLVSPEYRVSFLRQKYPEITVIAEPKDCSGIYGALNYGLKKYAATFPYLTYINDDDYWLKDFTLLIEKIINSDSIDIVYGKVNYFNIEGSFIGQQASSHRYQAFDALFLSDIILFTQQASIVKSEIFLKLNGFDAKFDLVADTDFWLRAIRSNYKLSFLNRICAAYTLQDDQLSSDKVKQKKEHDLLKLNMKDIPRHKIVLEKLLFRMTNLPVYMRRVLNRKYKVENLSGI